MQQQRHRPRYPLVTLHHREIPLAILLRNPHTAIHGRVLAGPGSLRPNPHRTTRPVSSPRGLAFDWGRRHLGDHHFSLSGSSKPSGFVFDETFSLQVENVLCGIWSGINHLGLNIGVYRMFFSPHELTHNDIRRLTANASINSVMNDNIFGWSE